MPSGKCGDGICDEFEKKNLRVCPEDCKLPDNKAERTCSEQNGIICSLSQACSGSWLDVSDSGRCCSGICSDQPTDYEDSPFGIHGPFETQRDSPDIVTPEIIRGCIKENYFGKDLDNISDITNVYSGIGFEGGEINPKIVEIPESYKQSLRKVIIENKDKIKVWHVQTEPGCVGGWFDNPLGYANLLKESYIIIKEKCLYL